MSYHRRVPYLVSPRHLTIALTVSSRTCTSKRESFLLKLVSAHWRPSRMLHAADYNYVRYSFSAAWLHAHCYIFYCARVGHTGRPSPWVADPLLRHLNKHIKMEDDVVLACLPLAIRIVKFVTYVLLIPINFRRWAICVNRVVYIRYM